VGLTWLGEIILERKVVIITEFWGSSTHSFCHFGHLRSLRLFFGMKGLWRARQLEDTGLQGSLDTVRKTQAEANSIDTYHILHQNHFVVRLKY
jgi:hypothetical protein